MMMKRTVTYASVLLLAALAACSTVEGAGNDLAIAGDAIRDEAREQKY